MPGIKRRRTDAPPGIKRSSWTRAARRADAARQRAAWRARNGLVTVPRNKLAFAQSMRTKLRYVQRVEFTPTGTSVIQSPFRANGMYDPYVPVGGHQPRGFDEMMAIYETFTVHGSTISCSFMYEGYDGPSVISATGNLLKTVGNVESQPALTPMVCGLHKGIETLSSGTVQEQMEKDRTSWSYINGQTGHKTLKGSLKVSDFYGKAPLTGSEGYTGSASADPDNPVLWEVWCGRVSDDYPQEQTKVVCFVTLEYDATFTEPKVLNAS